MEEVGLPRVSLVPLSWLLVVVQFMLMFSHQFSTAFSSGRSTCVDDRHGKFEGL